MLDPRSLSEQRDAILESCRKRGVEVDLDALIELYEHVAAKQTELNEINRRRNEHKQAGRRKLEGEEREAHANEGRALKEAASRVEQELATARARFDEAHGALPNLVHPEAPAGGEEHARELRRVGEPPAFGFEAPDHLALGERLDLLDFEAGAKVAGQKFYFLKNEAVLLEMALQRYALDVLLDEGFVPMATPDLARSEFLEKTGFQPLGEETQIYSLANEDLCLIGTSEVTLAALHADDILEEEALPLKLAGVSHCFRTEAGAAGRESKGLYRVHQFSKVEMFVYARPEDSEALHADLLRIEERIFQGLEIPYRVVDIAAGDLGAPAYRKFDVEAWMPGRGEGGSYGEVTSASNCTDYQARRLKVRFRRKGSRRNELVHMLNGTAVASSRTLLALLENHQRADGSVAVPAALRPYLGRDAIGPPAAAAEEG